MNPIFMDSTMPRLGRAGRNPEIDTERAVASWEAEVAENMAASAALEANA
jgi:hypothetical protein